MRMRRRKRREYWRGEELEDRSEEEESIVYNRI
jgi:hypothetical protein